MKNGFHFTMMCVGESGLGKSTIVNSLFNAELFPPKESVPLSDETPKEVELKAITGQISEHGVNLNLTVINVPGFGDFIDNEDSWKPILENIEARYEAYFNQETGIVRKEIVDNRVHALLYFIAPTGHSLKPLDIDFMKRVHHRVNLIPIIAKADSFTTEELKAFKQRILEELKFHEIHFFQPTIDETDDEETLHDALEISKRIPFAVIAGNDVATINGNQMKVRKYPWGLVEIENEEYSDFVKLRQLLIRSNMEDLKFRTAHELYEQYRSERLQGIDLASPVFKQFEDDKKQHEVKLKKMEQEMESVFQQKVHEKEVKLKQSEQELLAKHQEMMEFLNAQRIELEEKRKKLDMKSAEKKSKKFFK